MNPADLPDLPALLADWAAGAVRAQELFDRAWLAEARRWQAATAQLSPEAAAALAPLAPARQVIRRHEFTAEVRLSVGRATELRLGVRVVGAAAHRLASPAAPTLELPGWSRRRASEQAAGSRLSITVIPVPPPPATTPNLIPPWPASSSRTSNPSPTSSASSASTSPPRRRR